MPQRPHRPSSLQRRVFLGRDVIDRGLLTPQQLRSAPWRRLRRGVYADARLPLDHGLWTRAASLVIPRRAAITGASAAWLWGARRCAATDQVEVISPRFFGPVKGLNIRTSPLPAGDVEMLGDVRVTTPLRTAWEVALRWELSDAVAIVDWLARLGRVDRDGLGTFLRDRAGWWGARRAEAVFGLVDARAESPPESRLRVLLLAAGLPPSVPQYELSVAGAHIARFDLAWPEQRVAVEYDGAWHGEPGQLARDRVRLNRILAAGWVVHHVTARDLHDITPTIAAIAALLAKAR